MASSTHAPTAPPAETRPRRRGLRRLLVALTVVLATAVTGLVYYGARAYQDVIGLGKQAQEQVAALNREFPFRKPAPGQDVDPARVAAMLRVRERTLASLAPSTRQLIGSVLAGDQPRGLYDLSNLRLFREAQRLRPLLEAHVAALRAEAMSEAEYAWLLGLGVREALRESPQSPYWAVLRQAEHAARVQRADYTLDAQSVFENLNAYYRGYRLAGETRLAALAQGGPAAQVVDLLLVAAQWLAPAETRPATPLHRLTPGGHDRS